MENDADVGVALQFVQKWDLELAIVCGRHNFAGASATKGLLIGNASVVVW